MCGCSCSGCGNQRHTGWNSQRDRLTLPEKRAEDSFKDQLEDFLALG